MDRKRGNSLPLLPSTITKFHRRNAISGPSPTVSLIRSNTSSVSSQAVEEDEAELLLGDGDKENEAERPGIEIRHEERDGKSESKGDISWHTRSRGLTKRLVWVIFALIFLALVGCYLSLHLLLRSEYGGIAPLQPGRTSYPEDYQASTGRTFCYQVVNHQSIDSKIFLLCRESRNTGTHNLDSPHTPVPAGDNYSVPCPAHPIRETGVPSL